MLMVDGLRFPPVARQTLAEQVADILRAKIASGELPPGTSLREAELAELLSVGRAIIREACRQLVGEGLVVHQHHRGPSVWQPTPGELAELYELRAAMEGMCVRLILEGGRRDELLRLLDPIVGEMDAAERAGDFARADALDARFHAIVVELSGHQRLGRVWRSAHPVVWTAALPALRERDRRPKLAEKHRRLLRAFADCTPLEAQEAMIVHIREGEYDAIHNVSPDADGRTRER
jgi:DNA-binding GntR family transcriptional regulator